MAASSLLVRSRMRGSSSASSQFPLEENAFAVRTTAEQVRHYEVQVQDLITRALHEAERVEANADAVLTGAWEKVGSSEGFRAYRQRDPGSNTRAQYRLLGNMNSNYRDVMDFHHAETSKDLYEWLQFLYHNTVDAQILQTFKYSTMANPHNYFGVKWAVFQISAFSNKSYQCFVEYCCYRKDLRGREVGVRVTLPAYIQPVDYTMDALKIKRFDTKMVQILRPVEGAKRPTTNLFIMADNEFPYFVPSTYTKTLTIMGQNMPLCIDSRRINRQGLVDELKWVANATRRSCVVCTRGFGAARGRHHCRLCGDIMCRKCMLVRDTAEYHDDKTFKVTKTKFCVLCISGLRSRSNSTSTSVQDRSASPFNPEASKIREIEYAPTEFDDSSRISVFSETESEDYRTESEIGESTSARSSLSALSEPGSDKQSFASRLQEIAERIEDTVIEEGKASLNIYDIANNLTVETAEVIATIDTKDMQRENQKPAFSMPPPAVFDSGSPDPFQCGSNQRSLDQCLAEQEALLRQMVMASQSGSRRNTYQQQEHYDEYVS